jgi:hypothetical protein
MNNYFDFILNRVLPPFYPYLWLLAVVVLGIPWNWIQKYLLK